MITWAAVCHRAAVLPEVTESDHHGMPALRFRTNILATLPDPSTVRIMLSETQIREAAAEFGWCTEVFWGATLSAVAAEFVAADIDAVGDMIEDAWRRRAPKTVVRAFEDR